MSQFPCLRQLRCSLHDSIASSSSWRAPASLNRARAFTTTATRALPMPAKKKTGPVVAARPRQAKKYKRSGTTESSSGKKPQPGERKAMRKRIVLSNTNALAVPGLRDLTVEDTTDAASQSRMFAIPGPTIDSLRAVEAFKPNQRWSLFRRPATVWRKEAIEMARLLQSVNSEEKKKTIRKVVVGERTCGKSVLLLQAMTMAFLKGWIVVNLPDGRFPFILSCSSTCADFAT